MSREQESVKIEMGKVVAYDESRYVGTIRLECGQEIQFSLYSIDAFSLIKKQPIIRTLIGSIVSFKDIIRSKDGSCWAADVSIQSPGIRKSSGDQIL